MRPRADSRDQNGPQGSKTYYPSQAVDPRSQNEFHDSTTSYSSKGSGLRKQPDHDSSTSYPSQATSSRAQLDNGKGLISNSERAVNTQAQRGHKHYGSSASRLSHNDSYIDSIASRRGETNQGLGSSKGAARSRRVVQDDDDDDDDFASFGKYGVGL